MGREDILQEIPDDKLPELKKIYTQDLPFTVCVYNLVVTVMQIKKKFPRCDYIKIYCPNGDFSDGTIVAIFEMHCYHIFIFTQDKKMTRLEKVLRETKLIDYSKNPPFCALHQDFYEMSFNVRNEIGQPFRNDIPANIWWLPREKAIQYDIKIPENLYVIQLNESHASIMSSLWPHRFPESEKYVAKLIELNGGIGLMCKDDNELCAWALKNYFGGLGLLQVADKYKRKGYGTLVVKIFSKKLSEENGFDVFSFILRDNFASQNMFSKLGFQKITPLRWLVNRTTSNF